MGLTAQCITLHSDNYAVVHIINKQSSENSDIMILVRHLVLTCLRLNLSVRSIHIPGAENKLPDFLSRLQISEKAAPDMDPEPTAVPPHLLQLT